jgi:hypothetical protein
MRTITSADGLRSILRGVGEHAAHTVVMFVVDGKLGGPLLESWLLVLGHACEIPELPSYLGNVTIKR